MKRLLIVLAALLPSYSVFAQCTFQDFNKHKKRTDQYSSSSAHDIKVSQTAMSKQVAEFQKPKYAAITKPSKEMKKMQKEQQKKQEQAEL